MSISENNFKIIGVYKIINTNNGKFYVGSSVNIQNRWKKHVYDLKVGKHHNKYLQRAWNKYGAESFEFKVVEITEDIGLLVDIEQMWLNNTRCYLPNIGYNLSDSADRPSVGSNKTTIALVRTDMQKLLLNKQLNKNETNMLFVLGVFLSLNDNSVKINGKRPCIEEIKAMSSTGTNVCYDTLRSLENKGLLKRVKTGNQDMILYLNPYYIRYGKTVDKSIYDMFDRELNLE